MSSDVEEIKTIMAFSRIASGGNPSPSWITSCNNIQFQPDFVILKSVSLNTANATNATLLVYSDLTNDIICQFPAVSGFSHLNSRLVLRKPINQISFWVMAVGPTNSPSVIPVTNALLGNGGDVYICIELELVKLKKYDNHRVFTNS